MLARFRKHAPSHGRNKRPTEASPQQDGEDGHEHEPECLESVDDARRPSLRKVFQRTKKKISEDNLSIVAAGVAFYVFLGLIPALGTLISIYGLVSNPQMIERQLRGLAGVLPQEVITILSDQMGRISNQSSGATVGALVGILLAFWSGAKAMKSVITGLNIAYHEKETRGFIRLNATALGLTVAGTVGVILAIGIIVAVPPTLKFLHISGIAGAAVNFIRWPVLALLALFGFALVYRYGPDRDRSSAPWVSRGAVLGVVLWILLSLAFSFYASHFGNYNKTYGSLGAVVVLLLWFVLSAYVLLLGAEVNSAIEQCAGNRGERMAARLSELSQPRRRD